MLVGVDNVVGVVQVVQDGGSVYCNDENGLVGQHQYPHHCFVNFQNMNQDRLAGKYVINLLKAALAQFSTAGSLQNLYGYKK